MNRESKFFFTILGGSLTCFFVLAAVISDLQRNSPDFMLDREVAQYLRLDDLSAHRHMASTVQERASRDIIHLNFGASRNNQEEAMAEVSPEQEVLTSTAKAKVTRKRPKVQREQASPKGIQLSESHFVLEGAFHTSVRPDYIRSGTYAEGELITRDNAIDYLSLLIHSGTNEERSISFSGLEIKDGGVFQYGETMGLIHNSGEGRFTVRITTGEYQGIQANFISHEIFDSLAYNERYFEDSYCYERFCDGEEIYLADNDLIRDDESFSRESSFEYINFNQVDFDELPEEKQKAFMIKRGGFSWENGASQEVEAL